MSKINTKKLEKDVHKKIQEGFNKDEITAILCGKNSDISDKLDGSLIQSMVYTICEDYPDYANIQTFMRSKAIIDRAGNADIVYLYDPATKKVHKYNRRVLMSMLSSKVCWSHKFYTCDFVYNPFVKFKLKQFEGVWQFNIYAPPPWLEDAFYSEDKVEVPRSNRIPFRYYTFFNHLVNGDEKSYEYLLDWLANMIQDRNYCILTTIGNQGVGKGVLGQIMRLLVGDDNFAETDKRVLKKDFNGQIYNKRLLYLDEIKITTSDQENKLKALVNDYIEVEKKGFDAETIRNYSSLYFSSNNLDSIRISEDDRRFSVVELTSEKLLNKIDKDEVGKLLLPEKIKSLAQYLYSRPVDKKQMMTVFRSARTETIRAYSLKNWEEWFIEDYCFDNYGKLVPLSQISEDVENEFGSRFRPGRPALERLRDLYPAKFKLVNVREKQKDGRIKQVWHVQISGED